MLASEQEASIFNVLGFSGAPDKPGSHRAMIQRAIDAAYEQCGGRVLLPSGNVFTSGTIVLKPGVELVIEKGAVLKASSDPADYLTGPKTIPGLVTADGADHVAISGGGIIDGNEEAFHDVVTRYHVSGKAFRPQMIHLEACRHATISGITIRGAPAWTIHPLGCEDLRIDGIRILNSLRMANSDGIDPDHCRGVRITGCHIECADDCIVMKNTAAGAAYGPCEDIVISGCTLVSTSAAVKIGSETVDDFRRIVVSDCLISRSNRGLGIQLRDGGNVEDVIFSDIAIGTRLFYPRYWGKAEPIYVTSIDRSAAVKSGTVRNVSFHNIVCTGENGIYVCGQERNPIRDLRFDNVRIALVKRSRWDAGVQDPRPGTRGELIRGRTPALYLEHARNVRLHGVDVRFDADLPETYGEAVETLDAEVEGMESLHVADERKGTSRG